MQISQSTLAEIFKGFHVIYEKAYQAGDPMYRDITLEVPSTGQQEVYDWLGSIPGMRELVDEVQISNLSGQQYVIQNKEWENTIGVKESDILYDRLGIYNPLFASMGDVAAQHPDALVSSLLINGFNTPCYTGKNFFDNNHAPQAGGTTFTNLQTDKLSPTSFDAARTAIKSRQNAKGRPMNLGRKLQLVVAPQNESAGKQILQADFIAQTAVNTDGDVVGSAAVSNVRKGDATLKVWPQLSSNPTMWFLLETGFVMRPIILQRHTMPRLVAVNRADDSYVVLKHKFLYQAYGIYNAGYGLPEFAQGSNGTTDPGDLL